MSTRPPWMFRVEVEVVTVQVTWVDEEVCVFQRLPSTQTSHVVPVVRQSVKEMLAGVEWTMWVEEVVTAHSQPSPHCVPHGWLE
jgi:hypothetical protein